jgi:hypothetical protein
MEITELSRKSKKFLTKEKYEDLVKKLRKEHEKPVKGMFEFLDAQGGWMDFCYRFFKDDPIYSIRLQHGEICELPMGIVKHLNNTKKKIRKPTMQAMPGKRQVLGEYDVISRIRFTPVEYLGEIKIPS